MIMLSRVWMSDVLWLVMRVLIMVSVSRLVSVGSMIWLGRWWVWMLIMVS